MKTKLIQGRTTTIRLTIIHSGARVDVYWQHEIEEHQNTILNRAKALLGII